MEDISKRLRHSKCNEDHESVSKIELEIGGSYPRNRFLRCFVLFGTSISMNSADKVACDLCGEKGMSVPMQWNLSLHLCIYHATSPHYFAASSLFSIWYPFFHILLIINVMAFWRSTFWLNENGIWKTIFGHSFVLLHWLVNRTL